MCGIAGFYDPKRLIKEEHFLILHGLESALRHRGPDGYGYWLSDDCSVGMIHRRLSIQDLSFRGRQPAHQLNDAIVLSFNGEIYNHPVLKKELESLGVVYQSSCDTETIVHAYQQWGIGAFERFEGMFAFALYDKRSQELLLIRDRTGVKPLYFSIESGVVTFASEIKAFWTLPWQKKRIAHHTISHYLTLMIVPAPLTFYQGVYKLPAGWMMRVSAAGDVSFLQWYNPLKSLIYSDTIADEHEAEELLDDHLNASVKSMMLSDRPLGVFLSGGVDSGLLVALMSHHGAKINSFTVGYGDWYEGDETVVAAQIAKLFGTNHHQIILDDVMAHAEQQKIAEHLDEPHADPVCVPFYFVSRLAREHGIVVALVGEGADELFCGYDTYRTFYRLNRIGLGVTQKILPHTVKNTIAACIRPLVRWYNPYHEDLIVNWQQDRALFWSGALPFTQTSKSNILMDDGMQLSDPIVEKIYPGLSVSYDTHAFVDYHLAQLRSYLPEARFDQEMLYLELVHRLPELLLMRADKMSMAHGVEIRVPYLDRALVEYALRLSLSLKMGWQSTKYLLKRVAARYLPHGIVYKQKRGFSVPLAQWLTQGHYAADGHNDSLHRMGIRTDEIWRCSAQNVQRSVQSWVLRQLAMYNE